MYYTGIDEHKDNCFLTTVNSAGAVIKKARLLNIGTNSGVWSLLPKSDITEAVGMAGYASPFQILPGTVGFTMYTQEKGGAGTGVLGGLLFSFGRSMEVLSIVGSDPFLESHERLREEGILKTELDRAYWEGLRRRVEYWDGEKFVSWNDMWQARKTGGR